MVLLSQALESENHDPELFLGLFWDDIPFQHF